MANSAGVSLTAAMLEEEFTHMSRKNQECSIDKAHASQESMYLLTHSLAEINVNLNPRVDSKLQYCKNLKGNNGQAYL